MSKRKKKGKQTNGKPFVYKIENFIVQHPSMPSLDRSIEIKSDRQQKIIKILIMIIVAMTIYMSYHSRLVQMYMENWELIEPISQLIEWILMLVLFIAYSYIMK